MSYEKPALAFSFTVCRRMPWLPAAFSGDFLFHDSCPAPFACVGCPPVPAASAFPAVFPGPRVFARLLAGCPMAFPVFLLRAVSGGRFPVPRLSSECASFSFTVCRRMPWLPAAFFGDFLFHDSCPAPFVRVGCPLFPAVFGHAVCGFRRVLPVPALSVRGLSPQAGLVRQALKAFPFPPACIGGRRGCRRRRSFRGVSPSFPEAWPVLKAPPRSISLPSCFCLPFQARRRKYR